MSELRGISIVIERLGNEGIDIKAIRQIADCNIHEINALISQLELQKQFLLRDLEEMMVYERD